MKCLKIQALAESGFNYLDIIHFVSAHKNLETLEFEVQRMETNEYKALFEGIKQMCSLKSLSVINIAKEYLYLDYGMILQSIELLKQLKSLKLHLSYNMEKLGEVVKQLSSHSSLKKLDLQMEINRNTKNFDFDNGFYVNLQSLRNKLQKLRLFVDIESFDLDKQILSHIYGQIKKIILPKGFASRNYNFEFRSPFKYKW